MLLLVGSIAEGPAGRQFALMLGGVRYIFACRGIMLVSGAALAEFQVVY
jgi:hypothetical protein